MNGNPRTQAVETEIKLILPLGAECALELHPLLQSAETREPQREITVYYDTVDHRFRTERAALRVRETGGRHVQTLRLSNAKDSLSRSEWEWELEDRQPDLTHLHATPLYELAGTAVQPIFTSDVTRTIHQLRVADGLVEMATDLGWLRAGEQVEPIREVELELKEGRPAALFAIATSLQSTMVLLLSTESKARRGWRLATGSPHGLDNAAVPSVRSDVSGLEAFRDLVSTMLARLIESQPAASTGSMEGVHQMRIAIRRLRALLALFRPYLAREEEFGFTETLRQLGRILGEARDLDVFCTETLIEAKNEGVPASLLQALWRAAEVERRAAHARLARELEQPPLTPMVLSLLAWAVDSTALTGSPGGGALSRPLTETAPDLLERLLSKAKKRGRRIRHLSEEELHNLRRALKRLRYAIEFLVPLLKAERLKAYLHGCKELQEDLGTINDAAMAEVLARRLGEADPALRPAVAEIESWAEERRAAALAHLHAAWREFKDAPRPWFVSG